MLGSAAIMFSGAFTALATPFRNGALDEDAREALDDEALAFTLAPHHSPVREVRS